MSQIDIHNFSVLDSRLSLDHLGMLLGSFSQLILTCPWKHVTAQMWVGWLPFGQHWL